MKSIQKNWKRKQIAKKRGHIGELKLGQKNNLIKLDERFENISLFISLNLYKHYSKVV